MEIFIWLENTSLALSVLESEWAYPFFLSLHAVGLAMVVGMFAVRDLKLLGMFDGLDESSFLPLTKLGWIGFVINGVSGVILFFTQAATFATSVPFLIKISMVFAAAILAVMIQNKFRMQLNQAPEAALAQNPTKNLAIASLVLWTGAIVAGRLVAYI